MLCVALALAFATSSTASVMDRLQHVNDITHQHASTPSVHLDHHDAAADADHAPPADTAGDDGRGDRHTGPGHHHVDAPVGAPIPAAGEALRLLAVTIARDIQRSSRADGIQPGGLERPPRVLANLV